jgi:septal ring factor EnvC (AmiA/AmiB activator)
MKPMMNRRFGCRCAAVALLVLACAAGRAAAPESADSAQAKARLAAVRARITDLTNRLGSQLAQRDAISARVREAELVITGKRVRVDELHAQQLAEERRRTELRAEDARDEAALQLERVSLAAQVRAAYLIGRQEELKLLLNQDSPAALGRTFTYYEYFAEQRSRKIAVILDDQVRLQQLVAEIDQQTEKLKSLQDDTAHEMAELQRARAERTEALAALTQKLATGNQELAGLKREEQAVESLVADLAKVLQDFPVDASESFEHLRGKLPWPVQGRISAHYQAPRTSAASGMRWNGVMIDAARGAKVRAPFFGRVVYADWLQGLGLLLIIGHSGGYMTLYGHAEVLYKSVGDRVAPGDVVAGLSDTDGAAPQLYFEMREGRKTVDPKVWLRPNP